MINLRERGVGYASQEEINASIEDSIAKAMDAISSAQDDVIIPWATLDTAMRREKGASYKLACEMGLIDPRVMPSGLRKWVAVANEII